jgi:translation elongation factor EF-1beta
MDDEILVGRMLFLLSKGDDEPLPRPWELSNEDMKAGWEYFVSIADTSGGISLETFQSEIKKIVKKVVKETGLEETIAMFGMMAIATFVHSEEEAEEKVSRIQSLILDKVSEATPIFSKAFFHLFGKRRSFKKNQLCYFLTD